MHIYIIMTGIGIITGRWARAFLIWSISFIFLSQKMPNITYTIEADYSLSLEWLSAHGFLGDMNYS
ncbi:MAG TPA: hypothetical protein DHV55_08320 [Clostridiaceae bacterium]|nr:hypothetical protein [Clostridiaceae bacterium]